MEAELSALWQGGRSTKNIFLAIIFWMTFFLLNGMYSISNFHRDSFLEYPTVRP